MRRRTCFLQQLCEHFHKGAQYIHYRGKEWGACTCSLFCFDWFEKILQSRRHFFIEFEGLDSYHTSYPACWIKIYINRLLKLSKLYWMYWQMFFSILSIIKRAPTLCVACCWNVCYNTSWTEHCNISAESKTVCGSFLHCLPDYTSFWCSCPHSGVQRLFSKHPFNYKIIIQSSVIILSLMLSKKTTAQYTFGKILRSWSKTHIQHLSSHHRTVVLYISRTFLKPLIIFVTNCT